MKAVASKEEGLRAHDLQEGRDAAALIKDAKDAGTFPAGAVIRWKAAGHSLTKEAEKAEGQGRPASLLFPSATGVSFHTEAVYQQGEMRSIFFVLPPLC